MSTSQCCLEGGVGGGGYLIFQHRFEKGYLDVHKRIQAKTISLKSHGPLLYTHFQNFPCSVKLKVKSMQRGKLIILYSVLSLRTCFMQTMPVPTRPNGLSVLFAFF